jgi:two-component sensor histidine kinase
VTWTVFGDGPRPHLAIRWAERDGPPVAAPTRRGFGSRMIQTALANELHGEVFVDWRAAGLVCEIRAPMPFASAATMDRSAP